MTYARTSRLRHAWPVLLFLAACDGNSSSSTSRTDGVTDAYQRLQNALAECAKSAGRCAQDAGADASQLESCDAQEASCRESAGRDASSGLADAIQACIDTAKRCGAGGDGGVSRAGGTCKDALRACLDVRTDGDDDDGGRSDGPSDNSHSPVRACVEQMRECVLADGSAQQCADEMRSCVLASTPGHDDMSHMPADAGMSGGSHEPLADAGMSGGSHEPPADAGMSGGSHEPPADAGMSGGSHEPPADAGMPPARSCQAVYDACISGNGSRQVCGHMQRDCEKQNAQ